MIPELKSISPEPGRPLYLTVSEAVREAIDTGKITAGERLPSTKALSAHMSVSLVTVHRAMQELVNDGVLKRGQGKGTCVHEQYGRASRPGHGCRFGLVFHAESSLADSYHSQILEGVRQGADDLGADLVLLRYGEDWRNECRGYIFVNPFEGQFSLKPDAGRKVATESNKPVMVVGATYSQPDIHCIDTDNVSIGRLAVEHLLALGHRRIGFVGGAGRVSNDRDRWTGFCAKMIESGLTPDPSLILREEGWRVGETHMPRLREILSVNRPTAIFAAGYYFALDVFAAAESCGLDIPGSVSVIGVDDPPSASHLSPPLTTFRQPLLQLGRMAVNELFEITVDGTAPGRRSLVDASIIERASSAPPSR
ncbi:MAG: substrate-binding domain-containing protein [Phycisphaerales bacterium]